MRVVVVMAMERRQWVVACLLASIVAATTSLTPTAVSNVSVVAPSTRSLAVERTSQGTATSPQEQDEERLHNKEEEEEGRQLHHWSADVQEDYCGRLQLQLYFPTLSREMEWHVHHVNEQGEFVAAVHNGTYVGTRMGLQKTKFDLVCLAKHSSSSAHGSLSYHYQFSMQFATTTHVLPDNNNNASLVIGPGTYRLSSRVFSVRTGYARSLTFVRGAEFTSGNAFFFAVSAQDGRATLVELPYPESPLSKNKNALDLRQVGAQVLLGMVVVLLVILALCVIKKQHQQEVAWSPGHTLEFDNGQEQRPPSLLSNMERKQRKRYIQRHLATMVMQVSQEGEEEEEGGGGGGGNTTGGVPETITTSDNGTNKKNSNDKNDNDNHDDDDATPWNPTAQCSICLNNFVNGDVVCFSKNPLCNHKFHKDCMACWLERHNDCPNCRRLYLQPDKEQRATE